MAYCQGKTGESVDANKGLKAEPNHAWLIASLSLWLIGGVVRSA